MSYLRAEVLADAPQVYWAYQEAADASSCLDSSGNGRNGTENGTGASLAAGSIVPGSPGSCLNVGNGYWSDGAAGGSNRAAFDVGTGDFSYEIWLKLTNPTSDYVEILGRDTSATGNGQLLYLNIGTGFARCYTGGTGSNLGTTRISDGNLHHVVYRRIAGVHSVVVDAVPQGSAAAAGNTDVAARALRVGVSDGTYQRALGRWAHFAYYTTGLSDARIRARYLAGIRGGSIY